MNWGLFLPDAGEAAMIVFGLALIAFAVRKGYEPLLLLPIGLGMVLVNLPASPMREVDSFLGILYRFGIANEFFPLLIFIAIGAMLDFKPLLERPWLVVFGAAGQVGIFGALLAALIVGFPLFEAASIGVIGTADGPTSIVVASRLAPRIVGSVTLAAYSYMALVPLIQPPIMRLMTTRRERLVRMSTQDDSGAAVTSTLLKIFPYTIILISAMLSPLSIPLIGTLMFGNILATSGVTESLASAARNTLSSLVTLFLGIAVGSTMKAEIFLQTETLLIFGLGLLAFIVSTVFGVGLGKILHALGVKVNPLIGAAGLSSFPMSARLVQQLGREEDRNNFLLMHAVSANVSGQIGSVLAGGVLLDLCLRSGDTHGVSQGLSILAGGMGKVLLGLVMIGLTIQVLKGFSGLRRRS